MKRFVCIVLASMTLMIGSGCRRPQREEESKPAPLAVAPDPFLMYLDAPEVILVQGTKAKFKVNVSRKNYPGPIALDVRDLPAQVTTSGAQITSDGNAAEIELGAAQEAKPGKTAGVQIVGTATAGGQKVTFKNLTVTILEVPYILQVEPKQIKVQQGSSAVVKVQATRKNYQGPITLELPALKGEITAAKVIIPEKQTSVDVRISASAKAFEVERSAQVVGTSNGKPAFQGTSSPFKIAIVGLPFTLQTDAEVLIPYRLDGLGKGKLKVTVQRKDYQGPIALHVDGPMAPARVEVAEGQNSAEIEIAAGKAAPGKTKVHVAGAALAAENRHAVSPKFTLNIEGAPFDLSLEPRQLSLAQGEKKTWKVNVVRRGYDGLIKVELRNLPKEISAGSVTIGRDKNSAAIELAATDEAVGGGVAGIQAIGTTLLDNKQVVTGNIVLNVVEPFSLRVEPRDMLIVEGTKANLKVQVERRTYDGPIELVLRNLPGQFVASKVTIPEKTDSADIELTAPTAPQGGATRDDVRLVGLFGNNRKVQSPPFTVALKGKLFDLKVRPEFVTVATGDKTLLRVVATRKNYTGPIALELRNLPPLVNGAKVTIPDGQNEVDLEFAVAADAVPMSKTDVQVLGTATRGGNQQVPSLPFRVDIKQGLFDLKVEPAVFKLSHGATAKLKVVALRKGYKGPISVELKNLPKDVKAPPGTILDGKNDVEIEVKAEPAVAEGDTFDAKARGYVSLSDTRQVFSPRFTVSITSYNQPPALELKVSPAVLKIAQGGSVKVQVTLIRKMHDGLVTVDLRNLPNGLESSKVIIDKGQNVGEIILTAKTSAEAVMLPDVCAVASATMNSTPHNFASPQLTLQVLKK